MRVAFLGGRAGGTSGRRWDKAGGFRGRTYHLVEHDSDFGRALCGVRPGRTSAGWFDALSGTPATCGKCHNAALKWVEP